MRAARTVLAVMGLLLALLASPAQAQSGITATQGQGVLVLDATSGDAGWQADAGQVSPILPSLQEAGLPVASPISRLQLWPWPPRQGQTLLVWLKTNCAMTVTLAFAGQ